MRDVILGFDVCAYPLVFVAVFTLARKATRLRPRFSAAMDWSAIAVFLTVGGYGYSEVYPPHGLQILAILTTAGIAGCLGSLVVFVSLAPFTPLFDQLALERERREEARQHAIRMDLAHMRVEIELERAAAEQEMELRRQRAQEEWERSQPPPPPPPTRKEKAAMAKERYDEMLRMIDAAGLDPLEDRGGREEAKKLYLRELDAIWKQA